MEKSWHILRVVSGTERSVAIGLGVPAYVPLRLHTSFNRRHRRVTERLLPALPGMVFLRVPDPRKVPVLFPGVLGWMRDGTRSFIALTERDFSDMRQLELSAWRVPTPVTKSRVARVGDRVEFPSGHVFEGQGAIIERLKGNRALYRLLANDLIIEGPLEQVA